MPAGYSARCKVCNSPHRVQVEQWAKEDGLSPRAISARLAEKFQESIGHKSIWQHLREHFDVKAEAREQYQKSQANMAKAVAKQLSDIEMLDSIARGDYELHEGAKQWLAELVASREKVPKTLVDLLAATAGEVRQHVRQKAELLGDDPASRLADGLASWVELVQAAYDGQDASKDDSGPGPK